MTPFRRLVSCLCLLALLVGVPAQARLAQDPVAHGALRAHPAPSGEAVRAAEAGCHEHPGPAAVPHTALVGAASPLMDCCDQAPGDHRCGPACACPIAAPAIGALPPQAGTTSILHPRWSSTGHAGRTGVTDGPPTPPPRG